MESSTLGIALLAAAREAYRRALADAAADDDMAAVLRAYVG